MRLARHAIGANESAPEGELVFAGRDTAVADGRGVAWAGEREVPVCVVGLAERLAELPFGVTPEISRIVSSPLTWLLSPLARQP